MAMSPSSQGLPCCGCVGACAPLHDELVPFVMTWAPGALDPAGGGRNPGAPTTSVDALGEREEGNF